MYAKYAKLRDDRAMNDNEVAKAIGISNAILSEWKSEKHTPSLQTMFKIAKFFDVPIETFLQEEI